MRTVNTTEGEREKIRQTEAGSFGREFCGCPRQQPASKTHYFEVCKWELRHKDRRFAKNTRNLFFKLKKHLIQQVQHTVYHKARRAKLNNGTLTAGDCARNPQLGKSLVDGSVGYKEFSKLKGSPAYWEACKRDLYAMIRQLGPPTWFVTFSPRFRGELA